MPLLNSSFPFPMVPLIFVMCVLSCAVDAGLRIFQGRDANSHEYPYVVAIEENVTNQLNKSVGYFWHSCTGSAITPIWTLTAGHCAQYEKSTPTRNIKYVIRYGATIAVRSVTDRYSDIVGTVLHPNYKAMRLPKLGAIVTNDVALLKTTPIQIARYGKLSAVEYPVLMGQAAIAVGYGRMYTTDDAKVYIGSALAFGKPLQILDVLIKACDKYVSESALSPVICLSKKCSKTIASICPGDSGGPLIHSSGVVGVNHMMEPPGCTFNRIHTGESSRTAGIIVPISPYLEWITDQINRESRMRS